MATRRTRLLGWVPLQAALPVLLSVCAPPARADLCTALQSGTWGPIESGTVVWDCADPGADDKFVIPASITVTVIDDLIQDGFSGGGVQVSSGGQLTARVGDRRLTISFGGNFICEPGSVCELAGGYRELGLASPGVVSDFGQAGRFFVGDLIPCPGDSGAGVEPDCAGNGTVRAGDPAVYRFSYPHLRYDAGDGTQVDEHVSDGLAAVEPGEIACFFDPDPADPMAPVDDGFCYEIVDREADPGADPAFLEIDVRQTDPAAPRPTAYPLSLREIGRTTLDSAVAAGGRWVDVPSGLVGDIELYPGGVFEAERQYLSRWLRFGDGANSPGDDAHKIVRVLDDVTCGGGQGTCDRLLIGDPRGFRQAHAAGDEIWIDYGWSPGEAFFVMVPLVLASSTDNPLDGRVILDGAIDVEAVLFERTAGVELTSATLQNWHAAWIRDAAHLSQTGNGNGLYVDNLTNTAFERTSFSGGNPDLAKDRRHTVVTRRLTDVTFRDLAVRHHGDDCYTHATTATGGLMERFRCAFVAVPAESCNLFGNAGSASWVGTLRDLACEDCTSITDTGPVLRPRTEGLVVDGLLVWATGVRTNPDFLASEVVNGPAVPTQFFDVLSQGSAPSLPWLVDGFVVRDAIGAEAQRLFDSEHLEVAGGIVHDVTTGGTALAGGMHDGLLDNVLMYDLDTTEPSCSGDCGVVAQRAPATGMTISNVSFARSPGHNTAFDSLFRLPSPADDYVDAVTFDGVLMSGMSGSSGLGAAIDGDADQATNFLNSADNAGLGPCFWDNAQDVPAGTALPSSTLSGVDPGFVDPAARRFDLIPGGPGDAAGCGTRPGVAGPGLSRYRWIHAIAGLVPERMADDPDGDGLVDDPAAAACQGGATAACSDNCPLAFNPSQLDTDGDGVGDLCDDRCVGGRTGILRLTEASGAPGQELVVGANGIGTAPVVLFGDKPAPLLSQSGRRLTVQVPSLPVGETFNVSVVNAEGCRSLNPIDFTIDPPP